MNTVQYTGHLANSGGLQGHSLGESYPWAVIGVQSSLDEKTKWKVQNLCTGEYHTYLFSDVRLAHELANAIKLVDKRSLNYLRETGSLKTAH